MKSWQKTVIIIISLLGMGLSFIYHLKDPDIVGEIKAPVHINIEIDKTYMRSVSFTVTLNRGDTQYRLVPTTDAENPIQRIVLYTEIKQGSQTPFVYAVFLRIPKETASETLSAIDGISVFIGNRAFYFSRAAIAGLQAREKGGYLLFRLPGLGYAKSLLGSWINWYGDFNLAVKTVSAFFLYPAKFFLTWLFLICFLVACRSIIAGGYRFLKKQNMFLPEWLLLALILLAGFLLRFNGYVRYSLGVDELYSACMASNPGRPFLSTFEDPGNPPFYFILLRFWFMVFGWTEQSGRLLSVVLGSAAIVSLYVMTKRFADRKAALLAALFIAANIYLIDFSQEMRGYILEVFLIPIIVFRFLLFIQNKKAANLIWYIIPSVLLVNTHYYGSLFILGNFLFFIIWSVKTNRFAWNETAVFFAGNIIIALSLLPFFIHTALRQALLDQSFNTWIPKPSWKDMIKVFCVVLFIMFRKSIFQKLTSSLSRKLIDYTVCVTSVVLLIALGFSLYRPILLTKYLIILYPLLLAAAAIIIENLFTNSLKAVAAMCAVFAFIWIINGYETERGGGSDGYKESQAYIAADAESHPGNRIFEVEAAYFMDDFYGFKKISQFDLNDQYDILFFNPLHKPEQKMYSELANLGIESYKVLQIRVNESSSVFKIYP